MRGSHELVCDVNNTIAAATGKIYCITGMSDITALTTSGGQEVK